MKKQTLLITLFAILILAAAGCGQNTSSPGTDTPSPEQEEKVLMKIDAKQAKEMMDTDSGLIILDVRTQEEYEESHIKGALLLPDYEISEKAEEQLKDKNTALLVYCRSGRRSALAAQALSDLGYTSVYDFGGIIDWPYDVITEAR
ncbi:rhodanese-related sulfurtransferase [Anaerotaenia torta]|uniref:rhodanese-like domain-containing protein n=1 Tax=Anaerotaenia torta TaxID=433293 RepID=UPI003D20A2FE